ncbi:MAG: hypothetical protein GWM98_06450 [Nitrospinaceae bacterium]|nr:hypothetical protein [Nitrospinaceae bacterium]NIR54196.1 hypothetical protein [Nitrospinaceae bacterium]NIS84611.1 hypothetical protein [Nitrospinaceae bacterium]NIT81406.1 hypothetical protein [Nitrospinaceae bacterium]NIU43690.1 hypothetical protein [Nitrospinaceae bacterium]
MTKNPGFDFEEGRSRPAPPSASSGQAFGEGGEPLPYFKEVTEPYMTVFEDALMLARVYNDWSYFTRGLNEFRNRWESIC